MQLWPANENAFAASFAAASSRSASAATTTGVAFPSSRFTRLRGARSRSFHPTWPEPVNVSARTRSSSTRTSPISAEGPTTTLSQPAGSQRGRELVRDEVQREVERRDRADDADRHAEREGELALARLRGVHRDDLAGELPRLDGGHRVRRHRALRLDAGRFHRLAGLVGDRARDFVVAAAEVAGDADEDLRPLMGRERLGHRAL